MATEQGYEQTQVTERGMVTIPADLQRLDIEPGDKIRWTADEDGTLSAEVLKRRDGAFDDFDAVPMGGDGLETYDRVGYEEDPAFSEDA